MLSYFLKKRLKKHDSINNRYIASLMQSSLLQQAAVRGDCGGVGNDAKEEIVVSLTSFPARIEQVYLCIESLLQQSLRADRIILWLSEENFPDRVLPRTLQMQMQRGLEVEFVQGDLGPYKKYVYTGLRYPDSLMITVDDDILYPVDTLDRLYRAYRADPRYIYCHRAHRMTFDRRGNLRDYKTWESIDVSDEPSMLTLPTGNCGVLYPPGSLHQDAFNESKFMGLCPRADDIWLKAMSIKNGIKSVQLKGSCTWKDRFLGIPGSRESSLAKENWRRRGGNDDKIRATFKAYGIYELLREQI